MVILRQVSSEDDSFLYDLYAETRREELLATAWERDTLDAFLQMQFDMQKRSYALRYPAALHQLVLLDDVPAGRIMTDVTEEAVLLIDLSLITPYQKKGIGTRLIQDLQRRAEELGKTVRLHVLQNNPARNLYARLGFRETGEQFPYLAMEWQPACETTVSNREGSYNE